MIKERETEEKEAVEIKTAPLDGLIKWETSDTAIVKLTRALEAIPGIEAKAVEDTFKHVTILLRFRDVLALNTFLWAGSYRFFNVVRTPFVQLQVDYTDVSPTNKHIDLSMLVINDDEVIHKLIEKIKDYVDWYTSQEGVNTRANW